MKETNFIEAFVQRCVLKHLDEHEQKSFLLKIDGQNGYFQ